MCLAAVAQGLPALADGVLVLHLAARRRHRRADPRRLARPGPGRRRPQCGAERGAGRLAVRAHRRHRPRRHQWLRRGREGGGRKRFIVTDTLGLPLAVHVVAANIQERDGGKHPLLWTRLDRTGVGRSGPRRRFGAPYHGYRLQPLLSEEAIRSFEQLHGVTLPASYRDFLGTVAGGGAGPQYGLLGPAEEVDDEEVLHDLRTECLRAGFLAIPFPHTTDWPGPGRGGGADYSVAGTLVLGEIGCGTRPRSARRSILPSVRDGRARGGA
ncbi:SMI1/KNR4 family protein [Streptomyces misionensis]|uniref:SMI1/KNR4 family protein n=1 Tax=Streptomyces misionensis TaxID=67331 RepID=UPI00368E1131